MDANEIRLKCAEAAGLQLEKDKDSGLWSLRGPNGRLYGWNHGVSEDHAWRVCCPDYPHDLNACADLRKLLTEEERVPFMNALVDEVSKVFPDPSQRDAVFLLLDATAEQISRAFLAAKGLLSEEAV